MTASPSYPPAGAPPAPPAAQGPKRSVTWTGILLALGGIVAAIGAFLQYEKLAYEGGSYAFTGPGSETVTGDVPAEAFAPGNAGKIILAVGVVALVLGLLIAARKGRLWVSIVALVVSAIGLLLAVAAVSAAKSDATDASNANSVDFTGSVGIGATLGAVGMGLALLASILAIVIRRRQA